VLTWHSRLGGLGHATYGEACEIGRPPNRALQRPGARAGLRSERLESSMSRSLTRRFAWKALAPAAEGRMR
jgi:hypothetical protein